MCSLCMTLHVYSQPCEIHCSAFSFCALFSVAGDAMALCWVFKSVSRAGVVIHRGPALNLIWIKLKGSFSLFTHTHTDGCIKRYGVCVTKRLKKTMQDSANSLTMDGYSSNVPAFLTKLWTLVEDPETNHLICWSTVSTANTACQLN